MLTNQFDQSPKETAIAIYNCPQITKKAPYHITVKKT